MNVASPDIVLEVCLDSAESAAAAEEGGAHRVELCARLDLGGTTPSEELVRRTRALISIALHVMIRPRGGNFCYSDAEIAAMKNDVAMAKSRGADGVVFGMLRPDRSVDGALLAEMAGFARPLAVAFHRAFDEAAHPAVALEDIIAGGAGILLTSGQRPTALEGVPLLGELIHRAGGRIAVMPGAGIHRGNAAEILRRTGARAIHVGTGVHAAPGGRVDPARVRSLLASLGGGASLSPSDD